MAIRIYYIGHPDNLPPGQPPKRVIECDTDEEKPTSAMNIGDFVLTLAKTSPSDSDKRWYIARSTTALTLLSRATATSRPMLLEGSAGVDLGGIVICGNETKENFISLETVGTDYYLRQAFGTVAWVAGVGGTGADPPNPATGSRIAAANRIEQNATIGAVKLTDGSPTGLYRVSYFLRCTTADVTAGTITFTTTFSDGISTTFNSAAVPLTSITQKDSGTFVADLASGDITWATSLTGIAGVSKYRIRVRCEYLG